MRTVGYEANASLFSGLLVRAPPGTTIEALGISAQMYDVEKKS
jgi:hypothetical protein